MTPPERDSQNGNSGTHNSAPFAQANAGDSKGWIVALFVGLAALIVALLAIFSVWRATDRISDALQSMGSLSSVAIESARNAAVASERADKAERSAALSREYAIQVYPQLNRLGLPLKTPGEEHEPNPQWALDAYQHFVEGKQ